MTYLEDSAYRDFKKEIKKFTARLKNGGVGLFYYAGHGVEVAGLGSGYNYNYF